MRRILLVLAVAALMAAMMVAMAVPAFARASNGNQCYYYSDPTFQSRNCGNVVMTPSGNYNVFYDYKSEDLSGSFHYHTNVQIHPK